MEKYTEYVDGIDCMVNGAIWDEAIMYKQNGRYYIEYVGLGVKKRISKQAYENIKEKGYC